MPADLIFTNGRICTVEGANPKAMPTVEAVACQAGIITAVGDGETVMRERGPQTQVIDLHGKTLTPGLNDAHCHPIGYGQALMGVDARPVVVDSIDDILARIREAAQKAGPGAWISARGYDDTRLRENRHPTRHDLDRAAPENPVVLVRTCGHIGVYSSKALAFAGVTAATEDPQGGIIGRDAHGEPNGILYERAQQLVRERMPELTLDDRKHAFLTAGRSYQTLGVTTVADASVRTPDELHVYTDLAREGRLPVRTSMMVLDRAMAHLFETGIRTRFGDHWTRIGPFKWFLDGSGGGRTAYMSVPYRGEPDNYGISTMTQEQLDAEVWEAHKAGFQLCAHAIGDAAINQILTAYERALARLPKEDHRFRVEHCGMMTPALLDRMERQHCIAVPQPPFIWQLGDSYIRAFTPHQLALAYPLRSWLDRGIVAVGSSDAPVVTADPLIGLYAAVTRRTQDGQIMGDGQQITFAEALWMYTYAGAYANFEEDAKGTLSVGKLADFTIFDRDLATVDAEPAILQETKIAMTVLDGKVMYEAS